MIHAITSGKGLSMQVVQQIKTIAPTVDAIVIREKQLPSNAIAKGIEMLLHSGVNAEQLIIHTHVELAYEYKLRGCHFAANDTRCVGQHPFICGQSAHTKDEIVQSIARGMDYVYFSPIFPTTSKLHVPPKGLATLAQLCQEFDIAILALGGITSANAEMVRQAGAKGYASISMFFQEGESHHERC